MCCYNYTSSTHNLLGPVIFVPCVCICACGVWEDSWVRVRVWVCVILTLNCSSDMTRRWCEPCMSGERARSWATSRGSGRGAPWPSSTTIPTTGARCISWISLAGIKEEKKGGRECYNKTTEMKKQYVKNSLVSYLAVRWLVRLLCALQGEGGACMRTHSHHWSLPIGRVRYVNLQKKWEHVWKNRGSKHFFMGSIQGLMG